jgi:hypothetical protein
MFRKVLINFSVWSLVLIGSTEVVAKKVPVVTFERTPCLGNCQSLKLSIFKNRTMQLQAGKYVSVGEGEYSARLKRKVYRQLIDLFEASDFFNLENQHTSTATDLPTLYLTFRDGEKSKTVMDYDQTNPTLIQLEDFLQQIVDRTKWRKKRPS